MIDRSSTLVGEVGDVRRFSSWSPLSGQSAAAGWDADDCGATGPGCAGADQREVVCGYRIAGAHHAWVGAIPGEPDDSDAASGHDAARLPTAPAAPARFRSSPGGFLTAEIESLTRFASGGCRW